MIIAIPKANVIQSFNLIAAKSVSSINGIKDARINNIAAQFIFEAKNDLI